MCDFAKGDLVVCVDASPPCHATTARSHALARQYCRRGAVYRIEHVCFSWSKLHPRMLSLQFEGIDSSPTAGFAAARFRKLNDTADDAEMIARIKRCKPIKEFEPCNH